MNIRTHHGEDESVEIGSVVDYAHPLPPSTSLSVVDSNDSVVDDLSEAAITTNASPWYKKRSTYFHGFSVGLLAASIAFLVVVVQRRGQQNASMQVSKGLALDGNATYNPTYWPTYFPTYAPTGASSTTNNIIELFDSSSGSGSPIAAPTPAITPSESGSPIAAPTPAITPSEVTSSYVPTQMVWEEQVGEVVIMTPTAFPVAIKTPFPTESGTVTVSTEITSDVTKEPNPNPLT